MMILDEVVTKKYMVVNLIAGTFIEVDDPPYVVDSEEEATQEAIRRTEDDYGDYGVMELIKVYSSNMTDDDLERILDNMGAR